MNKTVFVQAKSFDRMWSYRELSLTFVLNAVGGWCWGVVQGGGGGGVCVEEEEELKPTIEQNATVQEGMFIHLMLRASLCLIKI